MQVYDIKQTEDGDIDLTGGDITWTESTLQHQRDLILVRKGDLLIKPSRGVGVEDFVDDDIVASPDLNQEIRKQFMLDGMTNPRIKNGNINAEYKDS